MGWLARTLGSQAGRSLALFSAGLAVVVVPTVAYLNDDTLLSFIPGMSARAATTADPRLVTFGPLALVNEGDHDFRQVIRISVPEGAGRLHVRLFDPDTGGGFDEPKGGFDTETRFSLYGEGVSARLFRDERGVVQESVEGKPLASASFRSDAEIDGRWMTLASAEASAGVAASGGRREFVLLIEGRAGNDGNVFDVAVSTSAGENLPPEGLRIYSYMPTFQVPHDGLLAELGFDVPAGAGTLAVENFDAAGGRLSLAGRFRSAPLVASGKSQWRRDEVALQGKEAGSRASLTATEGSENPNDMTMFVGEKQAGVDPVERPVAIELPVRSVRPSRRPELALAVTPKACGTIAFDTAGSRDPEGSALSYRWGFDGETPAAGEAALERRFETTGMHEGRLEVFDASGLVGNGTARDFSFLVKAPPVAAFSAPALVAEGAEFTLDGTASMAPDLPAGNHIAEYRWSLGDGQEIVQRSGEAAFGKLAYRYAKHGVYAVGLTVVDSAGNPCNSASATRTITVNAPPVANAGGPRSQALEQELVFDAGPASDLDGDALSFRWDFGDGSTDTAAKGTHRYAKPGSYTLTLSVDDGKGASNSVTTDSATIFVNAPPMASDLRVPEWLVVGVPGLFDASQAKDPDGAIASAAWDFGDGTKSDKAITRHSYATPGTYVVTLALTDDSGLANATTITSAEVKIVPADNVPPVPNAGGNREAIVDAVVAFDGSRSTDPDGSILTYEWDFGDGVTARGINAKHAYRAAGTYRATLKVTDDSGKENASSSVAVDVIIANKENVPPAVRVGGDRSAFVNEVIDFDATGTADSDGSIVAVDWDFGDGARASGYFARHAYRKPGTYKVNVLASDDSGRRGATSEAGFTVTVTDPYNKAPDVAMANELQLAAGVPQTFDASAAADPDGKITRYRWEFGDGAGTDEPVIDHTYARPGTYFGTLTLVDDSGLENGKTVKKFVAFVEERRNVQPVAEAGADQTAIVGQRVDFEGGKSADSDGSLIGYDWDFGNGKQAEGQKRSIAYFAPGRYEVKLTVTDNSGQNNATASDTLVVTVADKPNETPVAVVEPDRPAAIDEPVSFSGAASSDKGGNILSYDWDMGDGTRLAGREVVHAYAKSGTYRARLTVTDDSGLANQSASAERAIKVNQPPVAEAGDDQYVTASVVDFDGSKSSDPDGSIATYSWDFGDGETATGARIAHTYSSPGTYQVKLLVADDSGTIRNTAEDGMTVQINAPPVADAGFAQVAAPGENLTFDGSRSIDPDGAITSYHWDFRDGETAEGDLVSHAFAKPGRYTVELTVTDDSGHPNATDFSQIVVTVNEQPVADAGHDLSVAPGQKFTLSGIGSGDADGKIANWRWDVHGTNQTLEGPTPELSFAEPGIYPITLTVTDDSSAANRTAQSNVTISVNHQPVAEAGSDVFNDTLRVVLDASSSADADNDGLSYRWDFGDDTFGEGAVVEHTYANGGIYPVVLTVDDGRGLSNSRDSDAISVRVNRPPVAMAGGNKQACIGDVVVFDGSSSSDPDNGLLRYAWSFGDGEKAEIVNPTKIYAEPGTYRLRLQVTDESGLSNANSADESLITILPAPVADAGDDMKICANTPVRFDGTRSTDLDGVVNRFSWDFGDGQAGGGDQPEHTYLDPGTYRATLQIEGDNLGMCSPVSSDEILVTVVDSPKAAIRAPVAAATAEEVAFDGTGSTIGNKSALNFTWDFGDGTTGTGAVAKHAFAEPGVYRVQLQATAAADAGGCSSTKAIHVITVNAAPIADPGNDRTVEVGRTLLLSGAASSDPDGGISKYLWDFADGETATGVEVRHVWRKAGPHRVTLTVDDGTGLPNATSQKTFLVDVLDVPNVEIASIPVACVARPVEFGLVNLPADADPGALTWNFGDGVGGTGAKVAHPYAKPGTYTVGVSGPLDRAGTVETTTIAKKLIVNQPPVAVIEAERKTCPGTEISFSGAKSFDPDGKISAFRWDFGDGNASEGVEVTHRFEKPGTYPVQLTVTDPTGSACDAGTATLSVFVDAPPVADAGPDANIFIGGAQDSYVLDAGRSTDADGDPLSYSWTLSNGMKLEGERARILLSEPGTVTATVTATDPHGLSCGVSSDTVEINATLRPKSALLSD